MSNAEPHLHANRLREPDLPALRQKVARFEAFLSAALAQKYHGGGYLPQAINDMIQHSSVMRWDLLALYDSYIRCNRYPLERLERLFHQLFDTKLQLYYLGEVDLGVYNFLVYGGGYDKTQPEDAPHILLTRFSLDQNLIGKSRVLWERIMNFVYYLETGDSLESKVSRKQSKRKVFFDFIRSQGPWRFLEPYESLLSDYEERFRTPEFHKNSMLRPELFGAEQVDPNDLLRPMNKATNNLWENLLSIVCGGGAVSFNELHASSPDAFDIDPKYRQSQAPGHT